MSDEVESGPVMICATRIIRPGGARIGQLGANITLPRTIPLKSLIAGAIGGSAGILAGAVTGSFQLVLMGAILGAFVGVVVVSVSPVKGETLLQWLGVQARGRARQRRLEFGDEHLALYVGVARLHRVASGPTRITRGAVDVEPSQIDERGVLRSAARGNAVPVRPLTFDAPRFQPASDLDLPDAMRHGIGSSAPVLRRGPGDLAAGPPTGVIDNIAGVAAQRPAGGPNLGARSTPGT